MLWLETLKLGWRDAINLPKAMIDPPFQSFGKIPRLYREVIITEKIDGTNAQVYVTEDGRVLAGSRNRWITPEDDNHGFARWVYENTDELRQLGIGRHFGEWWGNGIGRKYSKKNKVFSLFNTWKWGRTEDGAQSLPPSCCSVVPIITKGVYSEELILDAFKYLRSDGSQAAPGFKDPEGIVIFHVASDSYYKATLKDDHKPKSGQMIGFLMSTASLG